MKASWLSYLVLTAIPALAQVQPLAFGYRVGSSLTTTPISQNGTIAFGPAVPAGTTVSVTLTVVNQSTLTWRIQDTSIQGTFFSVMAGTAQFTPGSSTSFPVTFTAPATTGRHSAILTLRFVSNTGVNGQYSFFLDAEAQPGVTLPGASETSSLVVSYAFVDRGNNIPVSSGGTIPFPAAPVGTRIPAAIVITNRGSTTAVINSASLSGSGFEMTGLPLLPANLIAGGETRFSIAFTPAEGIAYTGELKITAAGQERTFGLSGQGQAGQLTYDLITNGIPSRITPGSTIIFPSLPGGTGSTLVTVRARNTGNGESRLTGVTFSGNAFFLLDQPAPPIILKPGEEINVRVQFTPPDVGEYTGTLRIDSASFPLSGRGTGARLSVYLLLGEERFLLRSATRGVIPNTEVGGRRQFALEIVNGGDESTPISAIQFSGDGFNLSQLPPLPARIAPGQSLLVAGTFAPTLVGSVLGFLVVQDLAFQILGVGSDPPPLPTVKFTGVPAIIQPVQQPALGIEVATPYPYDLTGTVRLSYSNDSYVDDPAVQFLNGLRSIDFKIPANSTRAIFGTSSQDIRFQTGSIAGTITIVAQISTGKVDLTRGTPPVVVLNLPPSAPVIRAVEFVAQASKRFDVVITGAVTSRTLSRFLFTFTPKTGGKLKTTSLTADVSKAFETWFQGPNSRFYGGQFRATITFDLTADFGVLDSIEVTAVNGLGSSAPKVLKVTP